MGKPRICLITNQYWPQWNGVARSCTRFVGYLTSSGMDVHVIVTEYVIPDEEGKIQPADLFHCMNNPEMDENGALVYRLKLTSSDYANSEIIDLIIALDYRHQFHLFHGFWLPYAFPALIVAVTGDRPVIGSIRGSDANQVLGVASKYPFIKTALEKATWITSVSSDLIRGVGAIVDISNKSSVILNGIDTAGFPKWEISKCDLGTVGTAGQIRYKKAVPILIDAYSKLPKKLRAGLRLIGPYSSEFELRTIAQQVLEYDLDNECISTGLLERKKLLEEIVKLNVFVICSLHDGLPNALLEAAACGIPIVATNVGGMADVLTDGVDSLLVQPANVEQLSEAIAQVLSDPILSVKLSEGALALAKRLNHTQEKNSWLQLYSRLLKL
jgi:glycosyltransferase involved in cell wall biosynthesis